MRFLRYALVSLVSTVLGVVLAFAAQHGGVLLSPRDDTATQLIQETAADEFDPSKLSYDELEALMNAKMNANAIDEIKLEYHSGFFTDTDYEITFRRDGSALFVGDKDSSRAGKHTANIVPWDFYRLSRVIMQSGRFDCPAKYSQPVTDSATYVITVVQGGRQTVVSNYADSAPSEVWAVERIIVGIADGAWWQPAR